MLTPQQVQEKCFSKAFMGGYDMGEVDDFLDPLTEDYGALYKENALLKSKMKVLVEKIEEYRATEESMRQALRSAKEMASDIVEEAQRKTTEAPAASGSAELDSLRSAVAAEQKKLEEIKRQKEEYIEGMRRVLKAQGELLDSIDEGETAPAVEEAPAFEFAPIEEVIPVEEEAPVVEEAPVEEAPAEEQDVLADIVESVNEIADSEELNALEPTGDADVDQIGMFDNDPTIKIPTIPEEEEGAQKKHKFNFTNLQFGKDYEIK